ncbi:MAG TPA: hypothetical protein PLP29_16195 [Candidatus Ozemobacteraceae bacterium]|nr:hypothetical protein [Candidatus Ozemobacteraceae bacterium]
MTRNIAPLKGNDPIPSAPVAAPLSVEAPVQRGGVSDTLISLAGFLVNLYLVFTVYGGHIEDPERSLVFIAFTVLFLASLHQRSVAWLFGGMAVCYAPLILLKTGLSLAALASLLVVTAMGAGLGLVPLGRVLGAAGSLLGAAYSRRHIHRRLLKTAKKGSGREQIGEAELQEFVRLEADVARVRSFFDGSDPSLERVLGETVRQIEELQRDHARLLLRGAHLQNVLAQANRSQLENELKEISGEAAASTDLVIRSQLEATAGMKRQRLEELDRLDICHRRIAVQRLQILETVRGTYDRLNALTYTDVQTLQVSSDAIYAGLGTVRSELAALEEGLREAESMRVR